MNGSQYRKAIELAITMSIESAAHARAPSIEGELCFFIGALAGAISNGDPALAQRIRLVGQRAIDAGRPTSPGAAA